MNHLQIVSPDFKRIEFKDKRAYRCNDSESEVYVPSVSSILDCAPKGANFYSWLKNNGKEADTIAAEAMEKGSKIHKASEDYDKNGELKIEPNHFTLEEIEMIHRYIEFSDRYITKAPLAIEWGAGSIKLGFGGTLDRVIEWNGKCYLLDLKTGGIFPYYWRQLASYKQLWEQFNPDKPIANYGIIHLKAQTRTESEFQGRGWKILWNEKPHEYWWNLFKNTQQEFLIMNPNFTPNNKIFDLHIIKPKYENESISFAEAIAETKAEIAQMEIPIEVPKKRGRKKKEENIVNEH